MGNNWSSVVSDLGNRWATLTFIPTGDGCRPVVRISFSALYPTLFGVSKNFLIASYAFFFIFSILSLCISRPAACCSIRKQTVQSLSSPFHFRPDRFSVASRRRWTDLFLRRRRLGWYESGSPAPGYDNSFYYSILLILEALRIKLISEFFFIFGLVIQYQSTRIRKI